MEFKVGDKLRYIENRPEWYTEGAVYEVTGIVEGEDGIWIVINDNEGLYRGWQPAFVAKYFERIDEPQVDQSEPQPQVTKVKLTQEQARALEELKCGVFNNSELIFRHATQEYNAGLRSLGALSVEKFATALLIGYEMEQTPDEKVLEAWEINNPDKYENPIFSNGCRRGMKFVLNTYGIKVKGINDKEE